MVTRTEESAMATRWTVWIGAFALFSLVALLPPSAAAADLVARELPGGAMAELRAGPGERFPRLARLPAGTRLISRGCRLHITGRWCEVDTTGSVRLHGYVREDQVVAAGQRPPSGGGPDFFVVSGLGRGDRLNIRTQPAPEARVLTSVGEGTRLRNLGCEVAAGRRWCRVQLTDGSDLNGWANARYLREATAPPPPPPEDPGAGPDTWVVRGLPAGDRLNVRERPSTGAQVLTSLGEGERVVNLGCEVHGQTRWCRIRTITGVTGWARARFLREG
jgi:uncharacterized protein YraI